jgi:hypothetical protein
VSAAIPLSALLGTQGLALATTLTALTVFVALFVSLSRALQLRPLHTALHLFGYVALAGVAMTVTNLALDALGLSPAAVATASLPVGVIVHLVVLALLGDESYQRMLTFARGCFVARPA